MFVVFGAEGSRKVRYPAGRASRLCCWQHLENSKRLPQFATFADIWNLFWPLRVRLLFIYVEPRSHACFWISRGKIVLGLNCGIFWKLYSLQRISFWRSAWPFDWTLAVVQYILVSVLSLHLLPEVISRYCIAADGLTGDRVIGGRIVCSLVSLLSSDFSGNSYIAWPTNQANLVHSGDVVLISCTFRGLSIVQFAGYSMSLFAVQILWWMNECLTSQWWKSEHSEVVSWWWWLIVLPSSCCAGFVS